jgi:DNA polymerase
MDRNEAILREFNLYPLWVRRDAPVAEQQAEAQQPAPDAAEPVAPSCADDTSPQPLSSALSSMTEGDAQSEGTARRAPTVDEPLRDWPQLKEVVRDCTLCKLRAGCTQTVFGVGDEKAEWLFVGEGPGADEDAQGEPFVGQAGKLLDNMLLAIGLKRGSNVYIANIVKCRPPNNRNPEPDEVAACLPYLQRQIQLIQPRLIVALGKVAATALLGKDATLASLRGTLHDYGGIPLIITYHPAYLLRSPSEKAKAWQDLCLAVKTHSVRNSP